VIRCSPQGALGEDQLHRLSPAAGGWFMLAADWGRQNVAAQPDFNFVLTSSGPDVAAISARQPLVVEPHLWVRYLAGEIIACPEGTVRVELA
jgi:hypothetical protein